MAAAATISKDINTIDLDKLMETVAPMNGARGAQVHKLQKKMQDTKGMLPENGSAGTPHTPDCLATDTHGNVGLPTYTTKVPKKTTKGISLSGRLGTGSMSSCWCCPVTHNLTDRYLGPGFPQPASASPGPVYTPHVGVKSRSISFGKATRMGGKSSTCTPGPKYEMSGTLGSQLTRSSSPACKIGHAERFTEKQYVSSAHAKCSQRTGSDCQVGPATYQASAVLCQPAGPAYSFGSQDPDRPRFNESVFISRNHAKASGFGSNGPGPQPAITKHTLYGCSTESSSKAKRAPHFRFAGGDFGTEPHRPKTEQTRAETPGPGVYDPEVKTVKERPPAFTFGGHGDSGKRFVSSLSADSKGYGSPGPSYNPDHVSVQRAAPAFSFGRVDPDAEAPKSRFDTKRYIGPGISNEVGTASPGPAVYDTVELPRGPAYTMGVKERLLMKRICPAPDKTRFVSKELARENYGCYSPGPKYAIASTIGAGSPSYTFGMQDRRFEGYDDEQREKLGSADKPYTSPAEARFISKEHAGVLRGKYSPGPKYPDGDLHQTSSSAVPLSFNVTAESQRTTAPSVTIGQRLGKKATYDDREYNPNDRLTMKTAPGYSFSSASRYGGGPCAQVESSGKASKGESQDKRHIESSPGPGAFKPNHLSVESHVPSVTLGGLASSYNTQCDAKVRRPKTTSPTASKM